MTQQITPCGGCATCIKFDQVNTGDWLNVLTDGPSGNGLSLKDQGAVTDSGILIEEVGDASINIIQSGLGGLAITNDGDGGLTLSQNGNGGLGIVNNGTQPTVILTTASDTEIDCNGGLLTFNVQFFNRLIINGLPTASPGVTNAVWRDAGGILHIDP